jgi:ferredoxin/flavodoxin
MSTTIFYYTGTGNSLWAARTLTDELGEAELISMPEFQAGKAVNSGIVGLVFPVYIWGVPAPVLRFVNTMKGSRPDYLFAMVTNGGQVSNTLVQLKRVLAGNGLTLSSGFEIKMPSNYIPWGGPGAKDEQNRCFELAQKKITRIAALIKAKADMPVEMGPFWQRILFSAIYKMTFSQVPKMDRQFWTDDKCNSCGICSRVCPAGNISMIEGRPAWKHRCEQCFACLQWCPREAVQYGKKTPQYERYHHPEILLNDVLKSKSG